MIFNRYTPELFVRNFSHQLFQFEENTEQETDTNKMNVTTDDDDCDFNEKNGIRSILNLLQKNFIYHIANTKLDSYEISSAVLKCLTQLAHLYKHFFSSSVNLTNQEKSFTYISPLLKSHLKDSNSLVNFVKELDNKFDDTPQFIELLSKFLVYINLILTSLSVAETEFIIDINKLKELFKWSNSNFNITDLHIDSISICKSMQSRPNNENSLDNVLVMIVNAEQDCKEESGLLGKIKFCANQTRRLVNTLNEVRNTYENETNIGNFYFLNTRLDF